MLRYLKKNWPSMRMKIFVLVVRSVSEFTWVWTSFIYGVIRWLIETNQKHPYNIQLQSLSFKVPLVWDGITNLIVGTSEVESPKCCHAVRTRVSTVEPLLYDPRYPLRDGSLVGLGHGPGNFESPWYGDLRYTTLLVSPLNVVLMS